MFAHRGDVIADLGKGIAQLRLGASKLLAPVLQLQGIVLEDPTWIQWLDRKGEGKTVPARKIKNGIEPAPGRYAMMK